MKRAAGLLFAVWILPVALQAQLVAFDYSHLYETSKPAIVQVSTDDGAGSGIVRGRRITMRHLNGVPSCPRVIVCLS